MILQCLGELCGYLDTLLDMRNSEKHWGRFEWPEWVGLVETCFNFKKKDLQKSERNEAFEKLVKINNSPYTLTEKEEVALKEEYVTLQLVIQSVVDNMTEKATMEDVMYRIYTEFSLYSNSKRVLAYALRWLSKTFNEGNCESFFHALKETDESGKPLAFKQLNNYATLSTMGQTPSLRKH